MLRRIWYFLFDWTFYLPGVSAQMSGMTRAQQSAARLFVWRRLFRSVNYWLLTLAILGLMTPLVVILPQRIVRAFAGSPGWLGSRLLLAVLLSAVGVAAAVGVAILGMEPLRAMVRRAFDAYLDSAGLRLCRACGYDLRENVAARCPECGVVAATR